MVLDYQENSELADYEFHMNFIIAKCNIINLEKII